MESRSVIFGVSAVIGFDENRGFVMISGDMDSTEMGEAWRI